MGAETSVLYNNVTFSGENVLMYDDMNCKIVSFWRSGKIYLYL